MKDKMLKFMAEQLLCTVATVAEGSAPEAAYVGYSSSQDLMIIIGTSKKSRKYQNLQSNKKVAIVIADTTAEVQYEGVAEEITVEEYDTYVDEQRVRMLPGSEKYRGNPDQIHLKITPTWVRFISHGDPDKVEEFTEFS